MEEYQFDNGKMCGYIKVNENGIIIETMPVLRKFVGQPLENLISWTLQNFEYCDLTKLKDE